MKPLLHKIALAIAAFGPGGIFALAAIDSLGVPLPAAVDVLVLGTAAESSHAPVRAYTSALLAAAGSLAGSAALFEAARRGSRFFGSRQQTQDNRARFEAWFSRYGLVSVFVPAVTPIVPLPLKLFVVSAGALRARMRRFLTVMLAARVIRYLGLAWLGIQMGSGAMQFLRRHSAALAAAALVLAVLVMVLKRWSQPNSQTA